MSKTTADGDGSHLARRSMEVFRDVLIHCRKQGLIGPFEDARQVDNERTSSAYL